MTFLYSQKWAFRTPAPAKMKFTVLAGKQSALVASGWFREAPTSFGLASGNLLALSRGSPECVSANELPKQYSHCEVLPGQLVPLRGEARTPESWPHWTPGAEPSGTPRSACLGRHNPSLLKLVTVHLGLSLCAVNKAPELPIQQGRGPPRTWVMVTAEPLGVASGE